MNQLKKLLRFIGRLWAYLPIIWNDVDYDYGAMLRVMQFKLRRMRLFIKKHGIHLRKDKDLRRMWIAEMLLTRIIDQNYGVLEHQQLCDKWGGIVFVKGPHGTELKHAKETEENEDEINADVWKVMQTSMAQEEADWKAFWEYLSRYMRDWWD